MTQCLTVTPASRLESSRSESFSVSVTPSGLPKILLWSILRQLGSVKDAGISPLVSVNLPRNVLYFPQSTQTELVLQTYCLPRRLRTVKSWYLEQPKSRYSTKKVANFRWPMKESSDTIYDLVMTGRMYLV